MSVQYGVMHLVILTFTKQTSDQKYL